MALAVRPEAQWPSRQAHPSMWQQEHQLADASESAPENYRVRKIRQIPHVGAPWTQGLEMSKSGDLVESSGDYPEGVGSFVRVIDKQTGLPKQMVRDGLGS